LSELNPRIERAQSCEQGGHWVNHPTALPALASVFSEKGGYLI
jgi:hypothetical protein